MKKIAILLILLITSCNCKAQQIQESNLNVKIIGTWIAEDDPKVKLVFSSDGKYKSYYNNELIHTFTYSFSHECGSESNPKAWYLKTLDQDGLNMECYHVHGADANNNRKLSMRNMRIGKLFIYTKQ